ncbi:hypothetical protein ABH935_001049 [Catenulispora sp. GAS73]|uniref:hypothetical protein n=1 Tax=Catenulispora sp. GAS73 TaxID=3156269 RepID=UPI003519392A
MRLDAAGPGWFRKATTWRGAQNLGDHKQHRQQTTRRTTSGQKADQSRAAAEAPDARVAPSL